MIILAAVLAAMSLICFLIGVITLRSHQKFLENCVYAKGTILSYQVENGSSFYTPYIRFHDGDKEVMISAQPIKKNKCPEVGTIIDIAFTKEKIFGKTAWEVIILKDGAVPSTKALLSRVLKIIGVILIIAAVIIVVAAFMF